MWVKLVVVLFMLIIVSSLGSGLYFLIRDAGKSKRTVQALTWRIALSLTLFILLLLGFKFGFITPHGL